MGKGCWHWRQSSRSEGLRAGRGTQIICAGDSGVRPGHGAPSIGQIRVLVQVEKTESGTGNFNQMSGGCVAGRSTVTTTTPAGPSGAQVNDTGWIGMAPPTVAIEIADREVLISF